jgi:hypothetical protein
LTTKSTIENGSPAEANDEKVVRSAITLSSTEINEYRGFCIGLDKIASKGPLPSDLVRTAAKAMVRGRIATWLIVEGEGGKYSFRRFNLEHR